MFSVKFYFLFYRISFIALYNLESSISSNWQSVEAIFNMYQLFIEEILFLNKLFMPAILSVIGEVKIC